MTITAVLKIGIKVIGLESKVSLPERLGPKAEDKLSKPKKNEAGKTAVWARTIRISQNHYEERQNESREQPDKAKNLLKKKNIKKSASTELGQS